MSIKDWFSNPKDGIFFGINRVIPVENPILQKKELTEKELEDEKKEELIRQLCEYLGVNMNNL